MSDSAPTPEPQAAETSPQRLGLALSGGGFRASFFHLGVLARLADVGLLRSVSVISTVSGGTIVGAYYYLHLKKLLEKNAAPTDDDYRALVRDVQVDFLAGVRKNIRGRILLNPFKNYRMALGRKYSRSDRVGDLYDRYLYKKAWGDPEKRGGRDPRERQIQLRWLVTKPAEYKGPEPFNPWIHNQALDAKVPILVMNATSLNTGHNWRFEAVRMGEPEPEDPKAKALLESIDVNERLEQAYFTLPDVDQRKPAVPAAQQGFPLAKAVAASACVPLLFHPLSVSDMYGGRRVQLVDGGVHDNQGVQALFDMECDAAIVSDASGLMPDRHKPPPLAIPVAQRAMSVYGTRVRIEQLIRAHNELQPPAALMHLLSGVPAGTVPPGARLEIPQASPRTDYGINREVQRRLARLRTDLDSFADAEAFSLMYSGYKMSAFEIDGWAAGHAGVAGLVKAPPNAPAWCFEPVVRLAGLDEPPARYMRLLDAGKSLFFKSLLALPLAPRIAGALAVLALVSGAIFGVVWGALHSGFDLGPLSNWWWFAVIALLPALVSVLAVLQLLGGRIFLWLGSAARLPG
jgi:predicted acylesterase/phospholipase RssA